MDFLVKHPWWRHQMATRSFYIFFGLCLNTWLCTRSRCRWFETPLRTLWRHCDEVLHYTSKQMFLLIYYRVRISHPYCIRVVKLSITRRMTPFFWIYSINVEKLSYDGKSITLIKNVKMVWCTVTTNISGTLCIMESQWCDLCAAGLDVSVVSLKPNVFHTDQ